LVYTQAVEEGDQIIIEMEGSQESVKLETNKTLVKLNDKKVDLSDVNSLFEILKENTL
jgi:hypothetical protein